MTSVRSSSRLTRQSWKIGADQFKSAIGLKGGFYPGAAVMRLVFTIYDQPDAPFQFDTFLNVAQPDDLDLLVRLSKQRRMVIHLFDLQCDYLFSKMINHRSPAQFELSQLIGQAQRHNAKVSRSDYAAALAAMKRDRPL